MATDNWVKVFEPNALKEGESVLSCFNNFCESYQYTHEALNREPPSSVISNEAKSRGWKRTKSAIF